MSEIDTKAETIVNVHLGFAMVAGAIPFPFVDLVAVTAIQMDMLQQLATLYEVDFNGERGKSLATAMIGSTIGTSLGRVGASAVKAIPGIGSILGIGSQVVFSGATTFALGKVFQYHFQNKGTLSDFNIDLLKVKFEEFLNAGKKIALEKEKKQSNEDILNTINKLMELKEKGVITEDEFNKTKWDLLAKVSK